MAEAAKQTATPENPAPEPHGKTKAKPAADTGDAGRPWPDAATADAGRLAKPLAASRCALLEHVDPGYSITLERGTPFEAVFEPSFWANFVMWKPKQIMPGQTVHVSNDEQSFFAVLKILDRGPNWAQVGVFEFKSRDEMVKARPPVKQQPRHVARWGGTIDKFRVLREGDNAVIKTGFDSEAAANAFIVEHERKLGVGLGS